jgi:hypothetical protein
LQCVRFWAYANIANHKLKLNKWVTLIARKLLL